MIVSYSIEHVRQSLDIVHNRRYEVSSNHRAYCYKIDRSACRQNGQDNRPICLVTLIHWNCLYHPLAGYKCQPIDLQFVYRSHIGQLVRQTILSIVVFENLPTNLWPIGHHPIGVDHIVSIVPIPMFPLIVSHGNVSLQAMMQVVVPIVSAVVPDRPIIDHFVQSFVHVQRMSMPTIAARQSKSSPKGPHFDAHELIVLHRMHSLTIHPI